MRIIISYRILNDLSSSLLFSFNILANYARTEKWVGYSRSDKRTDNNRIECYIKYFTNIF